MLFPVELQQWLKTACAEIRDARKQKEIYEELLGHIWEKRDALMAQGMEERAAVLKAVEEMGSASGLGAQLGRVYARSPRDCVRRSVWMFMLGILLQSLWFSPYLSPFFTTAGVIVMLLALWQVKDSCTAMRTAWIAGQAHLLAQAGLYLFCVVVKTPNLDELAPVLYFAGMLTVFASFASGLYGLGEEEVPVGVSIFFYAVAALGLMLSAWIPWGVIPKILMAALLLGAMLRLAKAEQHLYRQDRAMKTQDIEKQAVLRIVPMALAAALLPLLAAFLLNTPQVQVNYAVLATPEQQQALVEKGMQPQVASMLLREEAERFLSSPTDFYVEDGGELADVLETLANCSLDGGLVHFYAVSAQTDEKLGLVRMLFAFEWEQLPQNSYTDAIMLSSSAEMYQVEHCLLLGDDRMQSLGHDSLTLTDQTGGTVYCERVELRLLPGTRGYIAYTCYDKAKAPATGLLTYLHRTDMLEFGRDTAMDLAYKTLQTAYGYGSLQYGEEVGFMTSGSFSQKELNP